MIKADVTEFLLFAQLDGTIIAPTDSKPWGKDILQWLGLTKLKGITVQGKGIIDGRGSKFRDNWNWVPGVYDNRMEKLAIRTNAGKA
ncbi:hypothetical protein Goshw_001301, partial [Gossypium schwendimanii]|nr:hypothetical protein [Gossypium schwendimanii]